MLLIHIPNSVDELCEGCFSDCLSLSRVTFGNSSFLKSIGKGAFSGSRVGDIHIPGGAEQICESAVYECDSLQMFGSDSDSYSPWY